MALNWNREQDDLIVYTVTGKLSITETEKSHQETDPILQQGSNWKVLVVLQDFEGWKKEEGWANTSLIDETDQSVKRMALVGPLEWRDEVEMFTLKGMRPLEIEYFTDESQARSWLGAADA